MRDRDAQRLPFAGQSARSGYRMRSDIGVVAAWFRTAVIFVYHGLWNTVYYDVTNLLPLSSDLV
jgi:hypothetical protein